jgi:preprotein translocase subunit SecY
MNSILQKIKVVFTDKTLRRRVLIVLAAIVVFRLLAAIPVPGIDANRLAAFLANNQFLGVLNIFSGGGLSNLSIIMLGVGPYITASIILQLMTMMIPRLKQLYQEEGEIGRKKFAQYSRLLTVPLAALQGFSLMTILSRQGILVSPDIFHTFVTLSVIIAGSLLLMWIGELATEFGIANGVSLIIFAGIIAAIPQHVSQFLFTFDPSQIPQYILFLLIGILIIFGVVIVSEAERPIPVTYARRVTATGRSTGGVSTYLPIRVNQAGVMPIIFALSLLLIPQLLGTILSNMANGTLQSIGHTLALFTQNSWWYALAYFILVFIFTYFYTAITFEPQQLAENLQKGGAFVPGIRPGHDTELYVGNIVSRVTFVGALFLGVIAILPFIMQKITGITSMAIGGTALLIVVSVVLDFLKKIEAQLSMREY